MSYRIILLLGLLIHSSNLYAEIGSTNFEISQLQLQEIESAGGSIGDYYSGSGWNGSPQLYVSTLLANPSNAFQFNVTVPNDNMLYGDEAGETYPYAGFILYPTTQSNDRPSYTEPWGTIFPHMQQSNEMPIFEDENTQYPLIVYSHGSGGYPLWMMDILATFAEEGYIVMALFHGDGRFPGISDNVNEYQKVALRPLSIKIAIDELENNVDFSGHIDFDRIGAIGLSLGASTTMALLGGEMNGAFGTTRPTTIDDRIKAAGNFLPWLGNSSFELFGDNHSGLTSVSRPFMAVAGTNDSAAPFTVTKSAIQRLIGSKYLIGLTGEEHSLSDEAFRIANVWIHTFLDAFVKNDNNQLDVLNTLDSVEGSVDNFVEIREYIPPLSIQTPIIPQDTKILSNYPNPFNPETTIEYQVIQNSQVQLTIYDIKGNTVKKIVSEFKSAGNYSAHWNGKNHLNQFVPSGIYIMMMNASNDIATQRILLLK